MGIVRETIFLFFEILSWLVIFKCILSWIPDLRGTKLDKTLDKIVEPILSPIRNVMNKSKMFRNLPVDLSPIVLFLIIDVILRII